MKNKSLITLYMLVVLIVVSSCRKDSSLPNPVSIKPVSLGLYEFGTGNDKRLLIPITKVGSQNIAYYSVFDTGSAGMAIDVTGILPASMVTSSGIQITGDSVQVNGITVTSKQFVVSFGDLTGLTKQYGNLGYAPVTTGDNNGNLTIKRVPIFLYYKVIDSKGNKLPAHSSDVFGVGPGVSYANNSISSPLNYYTIGDQLTSGFKLAILNNLSFSSTGTFVAGLLTVGLTASDLSSTSGFIMHPLSYNSLGGYSPNISSTIIYNGNSISAQVLFDTGTPSVTIIEDKKATGLGKLPVNSVVNIITDKGFNYKYTTTSTENLTTIQNPNNSGDSRTILSIDFFIHNEYLTDYKNHQIGLKNN